MLAKSTQEVGIAGNKAQSWLTRMEYSQTNKTIKYHRHLGGPNGVYANMKGFFSSI
jgi:hypothetical protein